MSDAGIFIVGRVLFIATAWATFAVGLSWFSGLQVRDSQVDTPAPSDETSAAATTRTGEPRRDTNAGPQR